MWHAISERLNVCLFCEWYFIHISDYNLRIIEVIFCHTILAQKQCKLWCVIGFINGHFESIKAKPRIRTFCIESPGSLSKFVVKPNSMINRRRTKIRREQKGKWANGNEIIQMKLLYIHIDIILHRHIYITHCVQINRIYIKTDFIWITIWD